MALDLTPAGIAELVTTRFLPAAADRADATAIRKSFVRAGVAGGARARFLKVDSFVGFRLGRKSDSRCWLGVEASMHGGSLFSGFA